MTCQLIQRRLQHQLVCEHWAVVDISVPGPSAGRDIRFRRVRGVVQPLIYCVVVSDCDGPATRLVNEVSEQPPSLEDGQLASGDHNQHLRGPLHHEDFRACERRAIKQASKLEVVHETEAIDEYPGGRVGVPEATR